MADIYAELLESLTAVEVPVQEDAPHVPQENQQSTSTTCELNVLNQYVRHEFKNESVMEENEYLTSPTTTTITIDALIGGVDFVVKDLIGRLKPNEHVVVLRCNYSDDLRFPGYIPPPVPPKTNRGRKKKEKTGKQRKRQGNGKSFNNQITFETRVSVDTRVYKFKVFNNGRIQLPGVLQSNIDQVIECAGHIVNVLKEVLPCGDLVYMCPVLKNYRFRIKIPHGFILDVPVLYDAILRDSNDPAGDSPKHPNVFSVEYTRKKQKIAVVFRTPVPGNLGKTVLLIITASGKINILGGLYIADTRAIFSYISWIVEKFESTIMIRHPAEEQQGSQMELLPPSREMIDEVKRSGTYDHLVAYLVREHGDFTF